MQKKTAEEKEKNCNKIFVSFDFVLYHFESAHIVLDNNGMNGEHGSDRQRERETERERML